VAYSPGCVPWLRSYALRGCGDEILGCACAFAGVLGPAAIRPCEALAPCAWLPPFAPLLSHDMGLLSGNFRGLLLCPCTGKGLLLDLQHRVVNLDIALHHLLSPVRLTALPTLCGTSAELLGLLGWLPPFSQPYRHYTPL
jgi:hypothetical protein